MEERDRTILLVDDDPDMRECINLFLTAFGFRVIEGHDGLEALHQIQRIRPGVVVMDLLMPRLGGIQAIKGIRAFDASIRVVVVTGEKNAALHHEALASGASAIVPKPFEVEHLRRAVIGDAGLAASSPLHPESSHHPLGHGPTIVIIDEQPEMSTLLETVLTGRGYRTLAERDLVAAVEAVRLLRPELVLLSLEASGGAALHLLSAIQAMAPSVPVIVLSESSVRAKRALDNGAFDYVTKPIDVPFLLSAIDAAVGMKRR